MVLVDDGELDLKLCLRAALVVPLWAFTPVSTYWFT